MNRILRVVAIASAQGKYGGPFDTATRQMNIAAELGYETTLLAGFLRGDRPNCEDNGQKRHRLYQVRRVLPIHGFAGIFSFRILLGLYNNIRRSDLVHISISRELIPVSALLVSVLLGRRIVLQPHGMLTARSTLFHRVADRVLKPLVARANHIIALTPTEKQAIDLWLGGNAPQIAVLGNPVAPGATPILRSLTDEKEALFVARLHRRKRVDVFVKAAEIAATNAGWSEKYTVVGPDEGEVETVIRGIEHLPNLSYEGAIDSDSVTLRVQRCSVFVLTSENEPWGNVIALALASGIPVVISQSAAISPLVEKYSAGRVCADGDALSVATAIHELLSDDSVYGRASKGALALATAELNPDNQGKRLAIVYGEKYDSIAH